MAPFVIDWSTGIKGNLLAPSLTIRLLAPLPSVPKENSLINPLPKIETIVALAPSPKIVLFDLSDLLMYLEYVSDVINKTFLATPEQISPFARPNP